MNDYLTPTQQEAVDRLIAQKRGIIWWKVGEGKTRIAIAIYEYHALFERYTHPLSTHSLHHEPWKQLVVVCSPLAFRQWEDEILLHNRGREILKHTEFISSGILSTRKGELVAEEIECRRDIGLLVFDELWMYKSPKAKRSKIVHRMAVAHNTVGLSGSLITARNIEDLYGQAHAVGISQLIARNLSHFRTQFCVGVEDYGLKFFAKRGGVEVIQKRLATNVHIHFPKDVRSTVLQRVNVSPSPRQLKLFDSVKSDYFAELGDKPGDNELEIVNAAILITKLQQISDGSVLDSDRNRVLVPSPKCSRLLGLLEELSDAGERVVVWFAFVASLDMAFTQVGEAATCLSSDHKFDSEGFAGGKYKFAFATVGSGASLNDFKDVQYSIFYSMPNNWRAVQQAMGRTNRTGSGHQVCYYKLLATEQSLDNEVYRQVLITGDIEKGAIRTSSEIVRNYMNQRAH